MAEATDPVEAVARAMREASGIGTPGDWDTVPQYICDQWTGYATTAITALAALGAVMPDEAAKLRAEVAAYTAGIDTDKAIRRRSTGAHEWILRDTREQYGNDWLPLSVRQHFARDMPALLAEIAKLREVVAGVRSLCTDIRPDSIIGTSPEARIKLIEQVCAAVPMEPGGAPSVLGGDDPRETDLD